LKTVIIFFNKQIMGNQENEQGKVNRGQITGWREQKSEERNKKGKRE
jgi:hypothetical protein